MVVYYKNLPGRDFIRKLFVCFGLAILCASAVWAQPLIGRNGIVSSASFAPALSVGGAIAQGSIFPPLGLPWDPPDRCH